MTYICVGNLTIIGSDDGMCPGRHQAIIWTNAGILLIGPLGTNFVDILIEIHKFSFKKMHFKTSSVVLLIWNYTDRESDINMAPQEIETLLTISSQN